MVSAASSGKLTIMKNMMPEEYVLNPQWGGKCTNDMPTLAQTWFWIIKNDT
jgi:hypothetical protein